MEITGEISVEDVNRLVQRYCDNRLKSFADYDILSYTVRNHSESPQGFLGQHYFLNVTIKPKSDPASKKKDLKYFVKKAPSAIESFMQYIDDTQVFKKECNLLRELIPRLMDVNSKFDKFSADCYLIKDNMIIFENLAEMGYRSGSDRDQLLDYPHLLCALKTLASMHCASAILEEKCKSQLIDLYFDHLQENSFPGFGKDSPRNEAVLTGLEAQCALIKLIPKYKHSPKLSQIVEKYQKIFCELPEFCKPSKRFNNVFLQGDLWANNLLFKYDDSSAPVDCKIVDFQLSRYGPPMLDVVTLLSAATTSDFRREHMDALLECYYHFLDDYMTAHGKEVSDLVTKLEFKECIGDFRIFGLLMSCHISHETLMPSDITNAVYRNSEAFTDFICKDRQKYCVKAFEIDSMYRERMTDMLCDVVDNHILREYCEYNY